MVHTFRCLDRAFMLDVESGSVYEIDDLVENLIEKENSPGFTGDFSRFLPTDIIAAAAEIEDLRQAGLLFSPQPVYQTPQYGGVIKSLCLNVSHGCNLNCSYCFAGGGTYASPAANMSFMTACKAIDFLIAKSGCRHYLEVDFFGGEPLLNYGVVKQTVEYARRRETDTGKKFKFTVTTNALTLNDEQIDFFNREMYNVVVSIDGRKDVHNWVRKTAAGKDSFDAVLSNALNFRRRRGDKQYYVRGTFTSRNLDFCEDVLALNDYGFDQISLEPVVLNENEPLAIKREHLPQLLDEYEKLAREYLRRRQTDKWFNFFHFMLDIEGGPCENKRLKGCSAGDEYVCVAPSGDIYPCHQFDGKKAYRIGNVLSGEFNTAIPQMFARNNLTAKPGCLSCWAKYYCSGGCAANAVNFNGNIEQPYTITCDLMKKRVECALAVAALEKEK